MAITFTFRGKDIEYERAYPNVGAIMNIAPNAVPSADQIDLFAHTINGKPPQEAHIDDQWAVLFNAMDFLAPLIAANPNLFGAQ